MAAGGKAADRGGKAAVPAALQTLAGRKSRHGIVTAVSMMKDEGPYLLEWTAHHLAVGFTRLVVYTNDCSDGTDKMLMRLEELGLAHHRVNRIPEGQRPQPSALNYAQEEALVGESDWVLVMDADEFLCIRHGDGTLDAMLDAADGQGANGIVITWRIFGSDGVVDWSRAPVSEQYLAAAPPLWNKGWGVKTLFRFDPEYWRLGIHRPKLKAKWLKTGFPETVKWLNGSGRMMPEYFTFRGWRSVLATVGFDWAQMNHYAVKSVDAYAIRKLRGNVNFKADKYNADYWALQDRNEVRDETMLRYVAERKRIFDALLEDAQLKLLHFAALDRAEAQLAAIKAGADYGPLVESLKAAGARPIGQVVAKPPQARDKAKIAAKMSEIEKRGLAERAGERQKPLTVRLAAEAMSYVVQAPDPTHEFSGEWVSNRGILLPADPEIFTPVALTQLKAGKFERNLARNLGTYLPKAGRHLELGAGSGFLTALLARERRDLQITLAEADPARRAVIAAIWARNGIAGAGPGEAPARLLPGPDPADAHALAGFLAVLRPQTISLGAAGLDPDVLGKALAQSAIAGPEFLCLTGPLLAERAGDPGKFAALAASLGLRERAPLDPALAIGFVRKG